ncbi:melamine deaminase [Acrasis kona]|uniref:Melamine deaminase n=1 Tax=Acrasis kona TaxID=1008807 RepID=A0AAW2YVD0_9EUKA
MISRRLSLGWHQYFVMIDIDIYKKTHSDNVAMMCGGEGFCRHALTIPYRGPEKEFCKDYVDHPLKTAAKEYRNAVTSSMMDSVFQLMKTKGKLRSFATGIGLAKGIIITPSHHVKDIKDKYYLRGWGEVPGQIDDIPFPELNPNLTVNALDKNKNSARRKVINIRPKFPENPRYEFSDINPSVNTNLSTQFDIAWLEFEPEENGLYYPILDQYMVPSDIQVQKGDLLMLVGYPVRVSNKIVNDRYQGFGVAPHRSELGKIFRFGAKNISFGYATKCNNNIITGHLDSHPGMSGGLTLLLKEGHAHFVGMYCGAPKNGLMTEELGCTIMSVHHPAFCAVYATAVLPKIERGSRWMKRARPYLYAHMDFLVEIANEELLEKIKPVRETETDRHQETGFMPLSLVKYALLAVVVVFGIMRRE